MPLLDHLLSLIAPHRCLICAKEGSLLCWPCSQKLPLTIERCYDCQNPSITSLTCLKCLKSTPLRQVTSAVAYQAAARQLVARLKYHGAQAAAKPMAGLMASLIEGQPLIVPVPTSSARRRQRSYDQAELLARHLSRLTGLPHAQLLARSGERHQVGAGRRQRRQQLQGVFRVRHPSMVQGPTILLIDDVVTTGATLEEAARALAAAGASEIRALTFAQA